MVPRALTPANQITILRLIFVPLFAILELGRHYNWALGVLTLAILSDVVDGTVARAFKQETELGIALDPIADKALMATAFILLSFRDVVPWWLTILVLSRDVTMVLTALLINMVAGYRPFRPTALGKISTMFQVFTVFAGVAYQVHAPLAGNPVLDLFISLTAFFTVASGLHYLLVLRHRYAGHPAAESDPVNLSDNKEK